MLLNELVLLAGPAKERPLEADSGERDPVCGMVTVDAGAAHPATHADRRYAFCSDDRLLRFSDDPSATARRGWRSRVGNERAHPDRR